MSNCSCHTINSSLIRCKFFHTIWANRRLSTANLVLSFRLRCLLINVDEFSPAFPTRWQQSEFQHPALLSGVLSLDQSWNMAHPLFHPGGHHWALGGGNHFRQTGQELWNVREDVGDEWVTGKCNTAVYRRVTLILTSQNTNIMLGMIVSFSCPRWRFNSFSFLGWFLVC